MPQPTPQHLVNLAAVMARTCRCTWELANRQMLTDYLIGQLPDHPTDLALRLEAVGTCYQLVPQTVS